MSRKEFEAMYIAKHFAEALRLEEMLYRDCISWLAEHWTGSGYSDPEIQAEWVELKYNANITCAQ